MKKSLRLLNSSQKDNLTFGFFKTSAVRLKSTMILPVRSETLDNSQIYSDLKYKTQNSRQLFHENLAKTLDQGVKKFSQGKYKESEVDFDLVINSFAGFESDDLTINERKVLSKALTSKAEITTKVAPSSLWNIALAYARTAFELDQSSEHARDVYLSIKSEIDMDLSVETLEVESSNVSSHN